MSKTVHVQQGDGIQTQATKTGLKTHEHFQTDLRDIYRINDAWNV